MNGAFAAGDRDSVRDHDAAIKAAEQRLQSSKGDRHRFAPSSLQSRRETSETRESSGLLKRVFGEPVDRSPAPAEERGAGLKSLFSGLSLGRERNAEPVIEEEKEQAESPPVGTAPSRAREIASIGKPVEPPREEAPSLKELAVQVLRRMGPVAVESSDEDVLTGHSQTLSLLAHRHSEPQVPSAIHEPLPPSARDGSRPTNPLEMLQGPAPNSNWMVAMVEGRLREFSDDAEQVPAATPGRFEDRATPPVRSGAMGLMASALEEVGDLEGEVMAEVAGASGAEWAEPVEAGGDRSERETMSGFAQRAADQAARESAARLGAIAALEQLPEPPRNLQPVRGLPGFKPIKSLNSDPAEHAARVRLRPLGLLAEEE